MRDGKRVVLVTGATGGLGSVVVPAFRDAGAIVVGVARNGGEGFVQADMATADGARAAVEEAIARAGRIDALIHLMGGFAGGRPVAETDDATWTAMMDANLNGAFYAARAVLPHLRSAGWGRIVTVGARLAVEPAPAFAAYGTAKAGLVALTRSIAAEVKTTGVTANVILPGTIDTPANRAAMPSADVTKWVAPARIASLLLWLVSDDAADVNGAVIPIYGRS